jgi:hypothetical protein
VLMLEVGQEQTHNLLQTILQRMDGLGKGPGRDPQNMQTPDSQSGRGLGNENTITPGAEASSAPPGGRCSK